MNAPGIQSALHPATGSGAALISELTAALFVGGAVLFLLVMGLLVRAVFSQEKRVDARRWVLWGGVVLPVAVLTVLLLYALAVGGALADVNSRGPLRFVLDCISSGARALAAPFGTERPVRIEVTGKQWWWEVRYWGPGTGVTGVPLANELRLPAGQPVELLLESADVIHSFWVPALAGKVDMIPGRVNRLVLRASAPGVHRGQCAEYCGGQHALMALYVVVVPEPEFRAWLQQQARPATAPADPFLALGRDSFMRGECAECHTIRGTSARGARGPDLTHVGSRLSLAAGVLGNHEGTMAGWIAGAQDLKHGNHMPSTREFTGVELRALSAWLSSLE
ncbi:MAG TPA: cytochrome c oxidase subunit II [Steroidobacteraceae bacterium]